MKLPKEYVIVEIIPSHSQASLGFIVQLQALKIKEDKIINRLDLRIDNSLINNPTLLNMVSYDNDMFTYTKNTNYILDEFTKFIEDKKLLIIDNNYTKDYLSNIKNIKESVFKYLDMEFSDEVFDQVINKYGLQPTNHLVDLLYEALMFEKSDKYEKTKQLKKQDK